MTSGVGERRLPTGEFGSPGRGTSGEDAPARTGTARVVIGMAAMLLAVLSFALWLFVSRERDGLLLLVTIFTAVWFWTAGVFSKKFWSA